MDKVNMRRAILSQMYLLRGQMDSIIMMIEELEKGEDEGCQHPVEHRLNLTSMGGPEHWQCKICGYEFIEGQQQE